MEFALYKLIIYHYISYQYNSPDLTDLMGILLSPRPQNQNSPGLLYLWKMLVLPVRLKRGRLCLGIVVLLGCILLLKWLTRGEAGQQTWVSVLLLTIFLSIVPGNWAAKPLLGCEASKHQNFPPKFEDKFKPNWIEFFSWQSICNSQFSFKKLTQRKVTQGDRKSLCMRESYWVFGDLICLAALRKSVYKS